MLPIVMWGGWVVADEILLSAHVSIDPLDLGFAWIWTVSKGLTILCFFVLCLMQLMFFVYV